MLVLRFLFVYQGLYGNASMLSFLLPDNRPYQAGHSGGVGILREVTYTAVYWPMLYDVIIFGIACLSISHFS